MVNPEIQQHLRYNFTVNLAESAFYGLGSGLASFVTIVPLFISTLTSSAFLISLIPAIQRLCWQFPQLLVADKICRLRCYKRTVMLLSINQKFPFFGLAIVAFLATQINRQTILQLTFAILIWQGLGAGISASAWQSMLAKIIPANQLGIFYGAQTAVSNLMGIFGGMVAGFLLYHITQPLNFAVCFLCASVAMVISWFLMSKTWEPVSDPSCAIENWDEFWANLVIILQRDRNFRYFLLARMCSQLALIAPALFTFYAVRQHGMRETSVGIITAVLMVTQTIAGLVMGWLGDRSGHKLVLQIGSLACAASSVLAWLAPNLNWYYLVFVGAGIGLVALQNVAAVMNLEFGNQRDRPVYIGLGNTLVAPATFFSPIIGGWVADNISYGATFLLAAAGGLATALILQAVTNPRYT